MTCDLYIMGHQKPIRMRNRKYPLPDGGGSLMVFADRPELGLTFDKNGDLNGIWTAGDPETHRIEGNYLIECPFCGKQTEAVIQASQFVARCEHCLKIIAHFDGEDLIWKKKP